jgi:hypothetical protein
MKWLLQNLFVFFLPLYAYADILGTADKFAVLAGSTITNAGVGVLGATIITGNLGVSPGTACTGFLGCPVTGPGSVVGTIHLADGVSGQAESDLTTAYTTLFGLPAMALGSADLTLDGPLGPGIYSDSAATLSGKLVLNDGGVDGSIFVFQMNSLVTASGSSIDVSGLHAGDALFWVVGSSATLGNNTVFAGNILALTSITFDPGAIDLCGRALARNGAVSFAGEGAGIENQVSIGCAGGGFVGGGGSASVPEPSSLLLLFAALLALLCLGLKRRRLS